MGDDEVEGSKSLVLQLYGDELGPKLAYAAGYGRGYNYRKVLEPTDATAQCENTGHAYTAGMACYMCGRPIPGKSEMKAKGASDELWPECEHILPLTEGRWLLDIYMTNRVQTDDWSKEARALEYDQAHRVCNQAKRIDSYIDRAADGTVSVSKAKIKAILENVKARATRDIAKGDKRKTMAEIAAMDVTARTAALAARVQTLVDHINSAPFKVAGGEALVLLIQTALFVDPDSLVGPAKKAHDEWYAEAGSRNAAYAEKLAAFIHETEASYPVLASPEARTAYLTRLLAKTDEEQGFVASVVPPMDVILKTIYDAKAKAETPVDPSGAHFLSLVLYGLYQNLYSQLQAKDQPAQALRCELYRRMMMVLTLPGPKDAKGKDTPPLDPKPGIVFGTPTLSPADAAACKKYTEAEARAMRDQLRAAEEGTIKDTIANLVHGLDVALDATMPRANIRAQDKASLLAYAKKCVTTYLDTHPENVYEAQTMAARSVAEKVEIQVALLQSGLTSTEFRDMILKEMPFSQNAGRRRKTYRKTSKRRKTLRKRIRTGVVPK
jgi:hypothetical protein